MSTQRFRKKPVIIEAVQFTGTGESCTEVTLFLGGPHSGNQRWNSTTNTGGVILTLEGEMSFSPGDWIIRGVKGEFYPCKPDIFEATYEPVHEIENTKFTVTTTSATSHTTIRCLCGGIDGTHMGGCPNLTGATIATGEAQ